MNNIGEIIASYELLKKRHRIVAKNLRVGHLEADIITKYRGIFYLWEVRLRTVKDYNPSCLDLFLSQQKKRNLYRLQIRLKARYKQVFKFGLIFITRIPKLQRTFYVIDILQDPW